MTTTPDRGDKLRTAEAAKRAGVGRSTWTSYVSRGQAPARDGQYDGRTPWWYSSTIDAWLANRDGQGARTDLRTADK